MEPVSDHRSTPEKILQAAMAVFLEVGFERANLERIAAIAGVTKPTVYSHFGSKLGLLEALAKWQTEHALRQFSPSLKASGNVQRDLVAFGKSFLSNLLHPDIIRLHRFAVVEAMAHPELVAPLLNSGPKKLADALQDYLARETQAGRLRCQDPGLATQQLLGLLTGMDFLNIILSQAIPSQAEMKKRVDSAVRVFLNSYGPVDH